MVEVLSVLVLLNSGESSSFAYNYGGEEHPIKFKANSFLSY